MKRQDLHKVCSNVNLQMPIVKKHIESHLPIEFSRSIMLKIPNSRLLTIICHAKKNLFKTQNKNLNSSVAWKSMKECREIKIPVPWGHVAGKVNKSIFINYVVPTRIIIVLQFILFWFLC